MPKQVDYLLPGGRHGVLLIHGLTGTPAEMRFVAKGLNRRGYTTYAMQLAGHCGSTEDLLATGWRDWAASVRAAADRLSAQVDRLFVGGLSMGALLALNYALEQPDAVHGLALYGTTFRYDGWAVPAIGKLSFLLPWVVPLGIGRKRSFTEVFPYGLRDERMRQRIVGAMFGEDSSSAGLPGNPWPSLAELYRLARHVRGRLHQIRTPALVVHATEDDVASLRNARVLLDHLGGATELLELPQSYHMVTLDGERERLIEGSAGFFQRLLRAAHPVHEAAAHSLTLRAVGAD